MLNGKVRTARRRCPRERHLRPFRLLPTSSSNEADLAGRRERIQGLEQENGQYRHRVDQLTSELGQLQVELREQQVTLDKERRNAAEKLELLERNRDSLKQEFENLANRIFEQKNERFTQQTRTSLDSLLNPFRDQLQDFRKRVEDVYTNETRDRQALRREIKVSAGTSIARSGSYASLDPVGICASGRLFCRKR